MAVELTLETTKYELVLVPETHELVLQTTVVEITLNLVSGFQGIADVKTDSTIEGAGTTASPLSIQKKVDFLISLIAQIAPALEISNVAVTYTDELVVVITTTGGLTPITKTWELVGQTLTVSAVDVIEQADTEIIDLADVYPIVISNVAVTYDNGFIVDVTATGGFGELETTFIRVGENLEITVTDQIGIVATTIYDLAAESPLVIDSLTFEVEGETAVITCVASGGWGVLTYTLGVESNTTGIFEVTENDTYTINVVDELATGDVSDSIEVELFPLEKSDLLVWVDQSSAATLTNKIAGIGDVTLSDNLITNGNCELDYGWVPLLGTTVENYRSSEQKHSGTYSRKIDLIETSGIQSLPFTTKTGEVITYSFWVLPTAGTSSVRYLIKTGKGSTNVVVVKAGNLTNGVWYNVTGGYTETDGGSNASVAVYISSGSRTLYVDDFRFTIPAINAIVLPINAAISNVLVNAAKYYTSGNPLNVRTDTILRNENDQLFFDSSYKIAIYNKTENAKVIKSVFDWMAYTPVSVYEYYTTERTVIASEVDKHRGFGSIITIGSRIYLFYRDAYSHMSYDGILKYVYSENNGKTWSVGASLYTGQEIIDNNPQILIDDPLATPDCRDLRAIMLDDGTVLVTGFVAIGHNSDVNTRVNWGYKSFCLKLPYTSNEIDADNMSISYIANIPYSGGICYDNGIVYATVYSPSPAFVDLYKSSDLGITWGKVSTIYSSANQTVSETTLVFVGAILYCVGRTYLTNGIVCKSIDNGNNWTDYTSLITRIDGLDSILLPSNKVLIYGRKAANKTIDYYILNELITSTPITIATSLNDDCGYGNVILKDGIYYFLYMKGPKASLPITGSFAYAGQYFKAIEASKLNSY